jgi:hypothetical protein
MLKYIPQLKNISNVSTSANPLTEASFSGVAVVNVLRSLPSHVAERASQRRLDPFQGKPDELYPLASE